MRFLLALGVIAASVSRVSAIYPETRSLVDLGYAKHVPTFVNTTASGKKIRVYKNIRFGNSPTGERRFRVPDTHLPKVRGIQDGRVQEPIECISSAPEFVPFPEMRNRTWGREDCLFLDVYVPEGVTPTDKVPVLHWFVGSAYAFGSKETEMFFHPMGLFDIMDQSRKFIFIANNYRLGVPGWTSVPGVDMDANLGMHDCLAALKWSSKFISRFGGDPGRITAMGQSAGAGIIGLLTVLDGGKGKLPFQQAWISSPDIPPRRNVTELQRAVYQQILTTAGCTSLKCLRRVPEQVMLQVNDFIINRLPSDAGGGVLGPAPGFGPIPDVRSFPDALQSMYRDGKFHKGLHRLVVGNTANEGAGLSSDTGMPELFPALVRRILHTASDATIAEIQSHYDFAHNPAKLAWDWTTDVFFACNAYNIANAYKGRSRRYIFSLPPAYHGQDVFYMFYTNQETTPVEDVEQARAFQRTLLAFLRGDEIEWPVTREDTRVTNVTVGAFDSVGLPAELERRCDMVNRVVLDPANGV